MQKCTNKNAHKLCLGQCRFTYSSIEENVRCELLFMPYSKNPYSKLSQYHNETAMCLGIGGPLVSTHLLLQLEHL